MISSRKTYLHCELLVKINLSVKLCARNYATSDGIVNGANGIFKDYIETSTSKSFIWIYILKTQELETTQDFLKYIYIYINNFQG